MAKFFWKIGKSVVYVKGREKAIFISNVLPNVIEIDWLPSFKSMNNFPNEICNVKHSKVHCARRKVHELRYAHIECLKQDKNPISPNDPIVM